MKPLRTPPRRALLFLPLLLAASCIGPPTAPKVREPFWAWSRQTERRIARELGQAATAWDAMKAPDLRADRRAALELAYENAVQDVLETWTDRQLPRQWEDGTVVREGGSHFVINLGGPGAQQGQVSPRELDRITVAAKVRTPRDQTRVTRAGLGVPVVGQILDGDQPPVGHVRLPPNGAHRALTALIEFGPRPARADAPRAAALRFYDPLLLAARPGANPPDRRLAADFTAAKTLALDKKSLFGFSIAGLLYPEKILEDSHLYQLEPYDARRIPVVFVHGLGSDPHIWFNCVNAIYADPVLRAAYQPWYFLYPTGMAVPATAARLREDLVEVRKKFDPEGDDPGLKRMVLVGHSMGGLLSRLQTMDAGEAFWGAYFTRKPEEMRLSERSRRSLMARLQFQREPCVSRLIFITVPHRGSDLADKGIVMRLSKFIRLPVDTLVMSAELMSGNLDALNPQIRDWGVFSLLSLSSLSPRHPYLAVMNAQPISVPHHSVVGRIGKTPLEQSSDGVVPYTSAHLPTGTEKVVPFWHGCVEQPEVVAEVAQRLREHLGW